MSARQVAKSALPKMTPHINADGTSVIEDKLAIGSYSP